MTNQEYLAAVASALGLSVLRTGGTDPELSTRLRCP